MPTAPDLERPYLGRGWAFPPRIAGGDVATATAEADIEQAIRIILETAPGERVMRPEFGVGLRRMVFRPLNYATLSLAQYRIEQALLLWESRIEVRTVAVRADPATPGRLLIDIRYLVRESNTLANLVYPFYLMEDGQS